MVSIVVLVVMAPERRGRLVEIIESSAVEVLAVGSCQQARQVLETYPALEVVITGLSHRDGNWCDLLKWVVDRGLAASVVVSCLGAAAADERLWSEVLWRGGYDVLVEPYQDFEVRRSVEGAARAARGRIDAPLARAAVA